MNGREAEWNERRLRELVARSGDVTVQNVRFGPDTSSCEAVLLACEGMADTSQIGKTVLPQLSAMLADETRIVPEALTLNAMLPLWELPQKGKELEAELLLRLYSGELIIAFPNDRLLYSLDIAKPPNRTPEESSSEVSIKGPRDSFTESLTTNVALVRKRLKSRSLCCEKTILGERSRTSAALLYIEDVTRPEIVEEARRRLAAIQVDGVLGVGQLEEQLSGYKFALFPVLHYIGRPDFVADSLLRGRLAILIDGSPMGVVAPANLTLLIKSPEDTHFPFYYVAFERLLRLVGLLLAIFLPGFWIAVTAYNFDQIPFPLLATITSIRLGLPLSGPMDFFLMLGLFELFREAGIRLPKAVGQTVAVVGGLIVGDAAIRAGITGPATLVVAAISTMSMYTLVNQSLAGAVTLLRVMILILSAMLGIFGFVLSVAGLALYLATLESFGVPYMAPLSPLRFRDFAFAIVPRTSVWLRRRPDMLKPTDETRTRRNPP